MADSIEIVVNTSQAQAYIKRKRDMLTDMIAVRMDKVNQLFSDRVRQNLSGDVLQTRSGSLLGSVRQEPAQISGDLIIGAVTAGGEEAPYGIYFEEGGTGYYEIRPVQARVLAFMSQGRQMFAAVVNHPPTPKLSWFGVEVEPAKEEMDTQLNEVFTEVLEE